MNGVDKQLVDFARSCFVLAQSRQHGERNMAFFSVVRSLHQSRFKDKRLLRLVSYIELFIHRTFSWTRIESITVAPRPVLYLTFNLPTSQDSIMHYSTFQRNYYLMQFFHVSSSLSTFVHVCCAFVPSCRWIRCTCLLSLEILQFRNKISWTRAFIVCIAHIAGVSNTFPRTPHDSLARVCVKFHISLRNVYKVL